MSTTFRLGLFIVATLLILSAAIFFVGSNQSVFESTYRAKAQFPNVAGLNAGAEVRVGGIHEGTVKAIQLPQRPDEKVTVVMDLDKKTRDIVKKDSVASIKSQGLLGDQYVEISFGSQQAERLKSGETIQSEPPLEFSELMNKTDQILDSAKSAMQNIQQTTESLNSISSKINNGEGTVGALINSKSLYKKADAGAAELQENMEALKHNFLTRGFFKKRGYEDSSDLTKDAIARLPARPDMKTFVYDAKQLFDQPDGTKLKNEKALNEAGQFLEGRKFGLAVVAASAGQKGDSDKDRMITQARSYAVREYLAQNFRLDDTRIKTIGLGKSQEAGEADRGAQVRIVVYPPDKR
jgi:phospholipid/cholesterol/gamma-HCH transport system substrate-binding protein